MFLPTHLITGAIIDKAGGQDDWFKRIVIIAPVAFLSHGLLDYFNCGMFTLYHEVPLSISVAVKLPLAILILYTCRRYWWGMLWASIMDLEWVILGISGRLGGPDVYEGLHHKLWWPNQLTEEWGIVLQLVVCLMLWYLVFQGRRNEDYTE